MKHLVELHGGQVHAESKGLGQGATFAARFPGADLMIEGAQDAPTPAAEGPALSIMVVDDNVDAAQTLSILLEMEGHDVVALFDPVQALERAAILHRDVFILNIGLPGMDGIELARRIRALPGKDRAMLVALTGYGHEKDRQRSEQAGFDHHLVKPVQPEALARLLSAFGGSHRRPERKGSALDGDRRDRPSAI